MAVLEFEKLRLDNKKLVRKKEEKKYQILDFHLMEVC